MLEGSETESLAEVISEGGFEKAFEVLSGRSVEALEAGEGLLSAIGEQVDELRDGVLEATRPAGELAGLARSLGETLGENLGALGESLKGALEKGAGALEQGAAWLKEHPEACEAAVRLVVLLVLAAENPDLLLTALEKEPGAARELLDFSPLWEAIP